METQRPSIFSFRYLYFIILGISALAIYYPILSNQLLDFWDDQWVVMNQYTEGDSYKGVFQRLPVYFGIYIYQRTYTWYNTDTLKQELRSS